MRGNKAVWTLGGAALVVLLSGCRSAREDRIRELEAQRTDLQRQNKQLTADNAEQRQEKIRTGAELEKAQAENDILLQAVTERDTAGLGRGGVDAEELGGKLQGIKVIGREGGDTAIVLAAEAVRFAPGHTDITPQTEKVLRRVAKVLKETEGIQKIRVDGHTDSDPIRRSGFQSHEHLALERAKKVQLFLIKLGLRSEMLSVKGYGAANPVAPNDSAQNKAKNRRVELIINPAH